jgi:hypothetical protein
MPFIIPKITYPADTQETTLDFTYPPTEKPGIPDQEGVSAISKTLSGLKQTMWWREDEFINLHFKNVPMADLPDLKTFLNYCHQGGSFLFYPDANDISTFVECWLEDSTGSARSSSSSSSTSSEAWTPTFALRGFVAFDLVLQIVPGGISGP